MALSTGNQSGSVARKPVGSRNVAVMPKSRSTDNLDRFGQGMRSNNVHHSTPQPKRPVQKGGTASSPNTARDVSRVELLLAQKKENRICFPAEESAVSQGINKAIKQSAHWTDVSVAVANAAGHISPGNAAYAIHRLGCLNCFASRKRKAALARSDLVPALLKAAVSDLPSLDGSSLVLILDGCARLKHEVPTPAATLGLLAEHAEYMAPSFGSSQLPLILWAFSVLDFIPSFTLLAALDDVLPLRVDHFTPQGVCLTLAGFQAFSYQPSQHALDLLAADLHRMLPLFTRSEVASCLEAFSSFGYQPPAYLIAAILDLAGQVLHADTSSGKAVLSGPQHVHFTPGSNGCATRQASASHVLTPLPNGTANGKQGGRKEAAPTM